MERPGTAAFLGMSLDGFIAGPNDELDWLERGGGPAEDFGFTAFFATVDALLVGRRTWEVVGRFPKWPYGDRRVYVDGGQVVSQFLAAGLLDELTVSILPVVIGRGIRLFQEAGNERWMTLAESRSWRSP